jgi:hypothetical protein
VNNDFPNLINHQNSLVWHSEEKKEEAINEIKHKFNVLRSYYESKNVRFFLCFKNLINFIQNDIRQGKTYRFKLRGSDIDKIEKTGSLSDYQLRNEILEQVYWDNHTNQLSLEKLFEGVKRYVPHFKMTNDTSLRTWLRSQNHLYEENQGKMFRKL